MFKTLFRRGFSGFRIRMVTLFGGLFLIFGLFSIVYLNHTLSEQMIQAKGDALHSLARSMTKAIANNLRERNREVSLLAQTPMFVRGNLDSDELHQSLDITKSSYHYYAWIGVADANGIVRAATGKLLEGQSVALRPWFIHGKQGEFIGNIHEAVLLTKLLNQPSNEGEPIRFVDFASPIIDDQGEVRGVLATHADWAWVSATIDDLLPADARQSGLQIIIADETGNVLSPFEAIGKIHIPVAVYASKSFITTLWPDDGNYLSATDQLSQSEVHLGWHVIVRQPLDSALAQVNQIRNTLALFGLIATLVLAFFVYRFATAFSKPVEQLAQFAKRIGLGEESISLSVKTTTWELTQLGDALQVMLKTIKLREQQLIELNSTLEKTVALRTSELINVNQALAVKAQEQEQLARRDALTGIGNRMAANEHLAIEMSRFQRTGQSYAVLMVDIDYFKRVNDSFGHDIGDRVIQSVAQTLASSARKIDIVARFGGEEFLIILPGTDTAGALICAEKMRSGVEKSGIADVGTITITIGVATSHSSDNAAELIVARADKALYLGKQSGRNRVTLSEHVCPVIPTDISS